MADLLPQNFPTPAENSIASYSWTDTASGTGYQPFYAFHTAATGGASYKRSSPERIDSQPIKTAVTCTTTPAYDKKIDFDYDILFNSPRTIQGNILINASADLLTTGGQVIQAYPIITAYKVSVGGAETSLGSVQGTTWGGAYTSGISIRWSMSITAAKTSFAIGESLRFTVELWTAGTGGTINLWHDGSSRTSTDYISYDTVYGTYGGKEATDLLFQIPFRISL